MSKILPSLFPPKFSRYPIYIWALLLGICYLILALIQLFTFEKFSTVTIAFGLPGGVVTAMGIAGGMPALEILAMPYLLSMSIPPVIRYISHKCAYIVPCAWLILVIRHTMISHETPIANAGIFGATIPIGVSVWLVIGCAVWLSVVIYIDRGLMKLATHHRT